VSISIRGQPRLANALENFESVEARQVHIQHHQIEALASHRVDRGGTIASDFHRVPSPHQGPAHLAGELGFVLNKQ
jgi:hypothetical protein